MSIKGITVPKRENRTLRLKAFTRLICKNYYSGLVQSIPLLSLSGREIFRSFISQSTQAILLQKLGSCICY
jgi:hypothetical protein